MNSEQHGGSREEYRRVSIEAESFDGITALASQVGNGIGQLPEELEEAVQGLIDAYRGLQEATERNSSGRSRKKVREYAGREDISGGRFGHILRTLETFDLAVQDGNRWRLKEQE